MPMIGGEAAERAVLARGPAGADEAAGRDPHGLGWVVDWLYGDAVLPPAPLPTPPAHPPLPRRKRSIPVGTPPQPAASPAGAGRGVRRRRRARQLALL